MLCCGTPLNLAALIDLPRRFFKLSGTPISAQPLAWAIVLHFAIDNLTLCQSGPILLWLATAGFLHSRRARPIRAGLVLGLATCFKAIPIAFVGLGCLQRGRFRLLLGVLGAVVFTAMLGAMVLSEPGQQLVAACSWGRYVLTEGSTPDLIQRGRNLGDSNLAVGIVLARIFGVIKKEKNREAVPLANLSLDTVVSLSRSVKAIVVLLWIIAAWQTCKINTDKAWFRLFAMTAPAMLVGAPIVWTHYFIWLAPASVYLLGRCPLAIALLAAAWMGLPFALPRTFGIFMLLTLVIFVVMSLDVLSEYARRNPEMDSPMQQGEDPGE
jgi:hypothetical protein